MFHNDATNQNGIGTNLPSATLEVADTSVLAAESLTNPNLTAGTSWSRTGDMALAVGAATYTHATGVGTLTQASGSLAIVGLANQLYSFTYTISNLSAFVNIPIVTITTGFALTAVPLVINQAGVYTVIFRSAAVPGNFVINVTSASAGAFTMDTFSLKHVIGGNLTVNGNGQINGTLTATALAGPLTGNVTGNASGTAATVTGAAQTNITSVGTLSGLTVTAAPTFSALTLGSVPFASTAGLLSQDNANLFWDAPNHRLGIRTTFDPSVGSGTPFAVRTPTAQGGHYWPTGPAAIFTSADDNGGTTPSAAEGVLTLYRNGHVGQTYANIAELRLSRFVNSGANAKTRLDFTLNDTTDSETDVSVNVLSLRSDGNVGIGTTAAQTALQVGGATTALNSPIQWTGGTVTPLAVPGVLFTQTAAKVTTANAATTLFSTGSGTLTLPANLLVAGRTIRITMSGYVSAATAAGTHTLLLTLGGVTVATGTSPAVLTSVVNTGWQATATITCWTTGAGGTVIGGAAFRTGAAAAVAESAFFASNTTTAAANTTGTLAVDLTLNNGAAAGTYTTQTAVVEILN